METIVGIWIICAIIAAVIGSTKGEAGSGFLSGLIFGPLGIIFALASSGNRMPCPACRERIHKKASVCPHCKTPVDVSQAALLTSDMSTLFKRLFK